MEQIGTLPGGSDSHASAISGDGLYVVGWSSSPDGLRAFIRSHYRGMTSLGAMPGGSDSFATGIDSTGSIVVGWGITPGGARPFRWTPSGGIVQMSLPPGDTWGRALGVSPNGQWIVGQAGNADHRYATVWSNSVASHLPEPAGTDSSTATAVNDSGVSVGEANVAGGIVQPLRWNGGVLQQLAFRNGESHAAVNAVSQNGTAFGGSLNDTTLDGALSWGAAQPPVALATPLQNSAMVYAASSDGAVYAGRSATTYPAAFVINSVVGTNRTLSTYMFQSGVPFSGYPFETTAVSSIGNVVAGNQLLAGKPEGWVVRFPGAPALCPADIGVNGGFSGHDGVLDNNDFIAFISLFFLHDMRADFGTPGGLPGTDGSFDNNDFIAFISAFFGGCP